MIILVTERIVVNLAARPLGIYKIISIIRGRKILWSLVRSRALNVEKFKNQEAGDHTCAPEDLHSQQKKPIMRN